MAQNPYTPPSKDDEAAGQLPSRVSATGVFREVFKYLGAYLLGIIACIALTPVDFNLAGVPLWVLYPVLAPIGFFLFYVSLGDAYLPHGGQGVRFWSYFAVGFVPLVSEALAYVLGWHRLRAWRPLVIGFPVGFVGTLGVYYTAAASI